MHRGVQGREEIPVGEGDILYSVRKEGRGNSLLYTTDLTATRLRSFAYGLCKSGSGGLQ